MKLYILRAFETTSYSTHTAFIATSRESALNLCNLFVDKYLNSIKEIYADDEDDELWVQAFSFAFTREIPGSCFKYEPETSKCQIIKNLMDRLDCIEADALIEDSQVDGD